MFFKNWSADTRGVFTTLSLAAVLTALAVMSFLKVWPSYSSGWIIWLGFSAGGLGGILHEFAQSGGKLIMPKRQADGEYLGSFMGMLMGLAAGILAVQGLFSEAVLRPDAATSYPSVAAISAQTTRGSNSVPPTPQQPIAIQAFYTALLAGLGLKGITEAATGQAISSTPGSLPVNARIPIDLPPNPQPPKLS